MRALAAVEEREGGRERIVVSELPFMVNKARLIENIAELVRDKKIEESPTCATNRTGTACAS